MKYAYYPGCSLNATGKEYDLSTKAVAKKIGMELQEIPDWNCCGASAAHLTNPDLALALPARNLSLAEGLGLDIAVPCAACFSRMKATVKAVRDDKKVLEKVNEITGMEYHAENDVYNMLDIMANKVPAEEITAKVVKPLTGLKVACYYGCLLVRPPKTTQFDNPENPQSMEKVLRLTGATPIDWSFKTECCGASFAVAKQDVALEMIRRILENAKLNGAEAIATACPLCMLNLDMRQKAINAKYKTDYHFPVYYFTELLGCAMGVSPKEMGMEKHFAPVIPKMEEVWQRTQVAGREDQ